MFKFAESSLKTQTCQQGRLGWLYQPSITRCKTKDAALVKRHRSAALAIPPNAGIHLDVRAVFVAEAKIKMDPSVRWDDELKFSLCFRAILRREQDACRPL